MLDTLLLVDIQHDFLPGGALAVADGDAIVPIANRLMPAFDYVVASQDWHPHDHGSFAEHHPGAAPFDIGQLAGREQILWPAHCVQGTPGAAFASDLDVAGIDAVVRKGDNPRLDSYSAFYDNHHERATGLVERLAERGTRHIHVMGLAADVCVKFTALDALAEGFDVTLIVDGIRGVDMAPGDTQAAIEAMRAAGATVVAHEAVLG
ncbi:bifunctional nicotinamidase/pyrazinamidase [uncultured Salinisphaera sp.]|uniref:bifunctional nicotinamidase/pyrazinamidase n=1 Tax=uncultured Salinisphaera sp. TaxID=359372 RepID=UPI0032B1E6F6|tara:strand:+ start:176 stop:796 length:621 start_codon:yes stop_codon:yes gene_type:complete